jgi:hypothetical protein
MPVVSGLVLDGSRSLAEVCAPLATELSRCFWVIDCQSGPWKSDWMYESERNEALADRQLWDVPALANTSTSGLRPRTLPRLADRLILDEWSYFFAIDAPEAQALVQATALVRHIGDLSEEFLRTVDSLCDVFLCHVDGWWEFYCGRPDWCCRLKAAWPGCRERGLGSAGQPPSSGRRE